MSVTGPLLRRYVEDWHQISLPADRAEALARVEDAVAAAIGPTVDSLTLEDRPSRFRGLLAPPRGGDG